MTLSYLGVGWALLLFVQVLGFLLLFCMSVILMICVGPPGLPLFGHSENLTSLFKGTDGIYLRLGIR